MAAYFILPKACRNPILLVFSLVFYAWGEPVYVLLMIFSILLNYVSGLWIEKSDARPKGRKAILVASVAVNLGLLGFFKYADFAVDTVNAIFGTEIANPRIPLPIGISFYTFQAMSYTIDVYRRKCPAKKDPVAFGVFVSLFPQLIAGPIVRYVDVERELSDRKTTLEGFAQGATRFIVGLGKKVLIANNIGSLWTTISTSDFTGISAASAWLGILAFTFQIYFDFSGYSDMAIGLGKIFGFNFPENFDYPYISRSITEFWRRWHMTLGGWFRDYLYFPLGGSRRSPARNMLNLFIVWACTGFWHGASLNFILWGLYFGILIAFERVFLLKKLEKMKGAFGTVISTAYSFVLVVFGWVLFSFTDFSSLVGYLSAMFGGGTGAIDKAFLYQAENYAVIFAIAVFASTPAWKNIRSLPKLRGFVDTKLGTAIYVLSLMTVLALSVSYLVTSTYNPFLYFRF